MNKKSLKVKITLWYLLIITAISLAVASGMMALSQGIIINDVKDSVISSVNNLEAKVYEETFGFKTFDIKNSQMPLHILYSKGTQTAIYDENKNLIFGSAPYGIDNIVSFSDKSLRVETHNNTSYYVYDKKLEVSEDQYLWIKGIASLSDKTSFLDVAMSNNFIIVICFLLIAGLGGYLIVNKALSPVNKISETANSIINTNNLSQRINIDSGDDEIHVLAKTVDKMLDKIESSFAKEQQFTSDASHELRTPIAVIMSECEYAEECVNDVDEYKEVVSSIKNQAQKMSNLVSELLAISRMDNDKMAINIEETNLSELLDVVCDEQIATKNQTIKLEKHIEENIIEYVDPLLITRLFINIISNAYQYSEDDTTIKVYLHQIDGKTVFSVQDQGIGIEQENLEKIWDRFYQSDASRSKDSSGLGLPMVKWIADKHNIKIDVQSTINKGTQFTFSFQRD